MSFGMLAVLDLIGGRRPRAYQGLLEAIGSLPDGGGSNVVIFGDAEASALESLPVDRVFTTDFADEPFALPKQIEAVAAAAARVDARLIVIADSIGGRELAGAVAARLGASILTEAQGLRVEDGHVTVTATKLGGTARIDCTASLVRPVVILARLGAFSATGRIGAPTVERLEVPAPSHIIEAKVSGTGARATAALEDADVVISGGRGLGGPEPFDGMLADLAGVLGGAVGASRAVVDAGWVAHALQVGQTGRTVRPKLYVAVAISGAIQHRVGMQTAGTIVAVNKEANIPMAEYADLLVVGNAFAVIPELTRLLQKEKGHS